MSILRHTLVILALIGCGSKSSDPTAGSGSTGSGYSALGHKPTNARRPTPPPNIDKSALAVGASAPTDLSLVEAASGKPWTLGNELAKHARVIVMFYRGDWRPHCRMQLGELQSKLSEIEKRDIGVVAISVDDVAPGKALAANLKLAFPIVSDPKATALKAFGVFDSETEIAWPSIFVVSREGKVVHRWLADTFSERVATDDVLKALQ